MKSQKDINLAGDLDARDRQDIYRNFLLYCMSGNVVALPMGASGDPQGWLPLLCTRLVHSAVRHAQHCPWGHASGWMACLCAFSPLLCASRLGRVCGRIGEPLGPAGFMPVHKLR